MKAIRKGPVVGLAVVVGMLAFASTEAHASGFQLVEHGARGLGTSFAGVAAVADDATTVFWNPAGMANLGERGSIVAVAHIIDANSDWHDGRSTATSGVTLLGGDGGDPGDVAYVPNFFLAVPVTERVHIGFGLTVPFGLETEYNDRWQGRYHGLKSSLLTTNLGLSGAYKIDDQWSVGAGIDYQKADVELSNAIDFGAIAFSTLGPAPATALGFLPQANDGKVKLDGQDWSFGFNLGVLYKINDKTRVGLGYRSKVKHNLEGGADFETPKVASVFTGAGLFTDTDIDADVELPDTFNLSAYHEVDDKLAVVASVHYTNWSTLDRIDVEFDNPLQPSSSLDLQWDDTWRVSGGVIYKMDDALTVRGGLAWDESPIPDKTRTPRIPGNDRIWVSVGVGYRIDEDVSVDVGFAHLFVKDGDVDVLSAEGNRLEGEFESDTNILSFQLTVGF